MQRERSGSSPARLAGMIQETENTNPSACALDETPGDAAFGRSLRDGGDPFVASPNDKVDAPNQRNCETMAIVSTPVRMTSKPGDEDPAASTTVGTTPDVASASFSPRQDRVTETPTVENAQALFPPTACMFIANLCATRTDAEILDALNGRFRQFATKVGSTEQEGGLWIKVYRDNRGMPYAFAQYEASPPSWIHTERQLMHR
ncbi:hypothetical protein LTR66_011449 [Elasticomyces elasticus]|nr:hypothetical protein LTR66_011449 [Elasticomyces elasticus]